MSAFPDSAIERTMNEVRWAAEKFPLWPTDPLHAFAVLGEEVGELQKAVLQTVYEPHKSSRDDVLNEAVQVAAMALRFIASIDHYDFAQRPHHSQTIIALGEPVFGNKKGGAE